MEKYELTEKELIVGIYNLLLGVYKDCGRTLSPVQKIILKNGIKKEFMKGRINK